MRNITVNLLLRFDQMAFRLNMEISLNKTKSLTISRNYTKCEVKLRGTSIEQVTKFNYLGAEISAKRDLKLEVRMQAMKAARISGCLYNLIWSNKYVNRLQVSHIQGVPGGKDLTSGECSLGQTIPI
jgi:hypothetical protein